MNLKRIAQKIISRLYLWAGSNAWIVILRLLISKYLQIPGYDSGSSSFVLHLYSFFLFRMLSCHLILPHCSVFSKRVTMESPLLQSVSFLLAPVMCIVCDSALIFTKSFVLSLFLDIYHICSLTVNFWEPWLHMVDCITANLLRDIMHNFYTKSSSWMNETMNLKASRQKYFCIHVRKELKF